VKSLEEALTMAERENPSETMIVGGAEIYRLALPRATRVHLTEVHREFEGDTRLPRFEVSQWRETGREDHATKDGLRYTYVTLERR
jgi:dihydrofolate reductase